MFTPELVSTYNANVAEYGDHSLRALADANGDYGLFVMLGTAPELADCPCGNDHMAYDVIIPCGTSFKDTTGEYVISGTLLEMFMLPEWMHPDNPDAIAISAEAVVASDEFVPTPMDNIDDLIDSVLDL